MSDPVEVRKAIGSKDLENVFSIRRTVFVNEQNCPPEIEWEHEDESVHFLALVNGIPAGAARWRLTSEGLKLERFAVLKEFRGAGIGRALVAAVLGDLPPAAGTIYLNAQISAVGLYEKFGFVIEGEQFEEAGIMHYRMVKKP